MDKIFEVAIIGGGASGLFCANSLRFNSDEIIHIDKSSLEKKLLVTENRTYNLTNKNIDIDKYNTILTKEVIESFDQFKTIQYFKKLGIEIYFDEEGRGYPLSDKAKDVKERLLAGIGNVKYLNDEVIKVTKNQVFEIKMMSGQKVLARNVVMACGTKNIEKILEEFKLCFEKQKKVLTGFKVNKGYDCHLFGTRVNCVVKANFNGNKFCENGQVQFKKDGISGIVVFNLSAFAQKHNAQNFRVELELLPSITKDELMKILIFRSQNCSNLLVKDVFVGILDPQIAKYILTRTKIKEQERKVKNLTIKEIEKLSQSVKSLDFICNETYEDCQVLSGGIDLKSLDNLQTKVPGLYVCGECCNVYGPCGGYNLQWAWSSGHFVAKMINKRLN